MIKGRVGWRFWVSRIIFTSFFLLIAFWLVVSSMGLKIDWRGKKLVHTGLVRISIQPSEAIVFFDGKRIARGSLVRIPNIPPGGHEIKVEKANYRPWERSILVQPGEAILFNNIHLVLAHPLALPEDEIKTPLQALEKPDDIKINSGEIYIKSQEATNKWKLVTRLSISLNSAYWFPDKEQILLQTKTKLYIIDKDGSNLQELVELSGDEQPKISISPDGKKVFWQVDEQTPKGIEIR